MTRDKIIFVTEGLISCTLTTSYGYRARLVRYPKIATLTTLADVVPGASYSQHKHPSLHGASKSTCYAWLHPVLVFLISPILVIVGFVVGASCN